MSERFEDDLMDDLFYDEAEGVADFDEEEDDFDYGEDAYEDEFDEFEEDAWEGAEDNGFEDEFDEFEDYDEFDEEADEMEDELEDAMAYALGAEDADEFLGKIFRGIKKIGRKVFRVARRVVPRLTRLIPGPWGALASTGMRLLSRLRYEGASEEEALDAFAELAAYDEAAVPVVSALAVRSLDKKKVKRLPKAARKKMVKKISKAIKHLIRKSGTPKAVRAIPIVVGKVRAAGRPMPVAAKAAAADKIIKKVARSRRLTRKLTRKTPRVVRAHKKLRKATSGKRLPA